METPVRLGLVGLNFGAHLAKRDLFAEENGEYVRLAGVCDLDQAKAAAFAQRHGVGAWKDLDALLSDPAIEAVGLFTPPAGRAALVRRCIQGGKHVMTTKPFELDPEAALAVLREAREAGIAVHLNSPGPLPADDVAKIAEWREAYALGRPIAARWETYAKYQEKADGGWMDSPVRCPVAPVFRIGIYGINELIQILGRVASVQVVESRITTGRPTPDTAELALHFENGAIGSVFASFCIGNGYAYPASLVLHFENGTITKRQHRAGSTARSADFDSIELTLNAIRDGEYVEDHATLAPRGRSGAYQWRSFHAAVRTGVPLPGETTPESIAAGVAVVAAMARAEASHATETTVCAPPGTHA